MLPQKSTKTPEKAGGSTRPDSAVSTQGGTPGPGSIIETEGSQAGQDNHLKDLIEADVKQSQQAAEEIGMMILNSRKISLKDDPLGNVTQGKQVSKNSLKNNMKFEILNKDANGRSIVHRAAFDQQSNQMNEVISALTPLSPEERRKEIESPDKYGNTALMLACIRYYEDSEKQTNQ